MPSQTTATTTMVTIVAIPTYYQAYSYVFLYARSPDVHPTTTTRYIVLIPASTEALTTRNAAIAKDVAAWGWRVYITDPSAPNMKKWLKKYYKAVSTQTWDDDIWRIWQREHGLKIAWADMQRKDKEASEKGKKGKFVHGVKKAGMYFGKDGVIICSDEQRLRKEEERRWKLADNRIARRFEDLPDDPFVNPPIQSSRSIEEGGFKAGNLRGGSSVDAKETTLEETVASDVEPLTRHSWLARG